MIIWFIWLYLIGFRDIWQDNIRKKTHSNKQWFRMWILSKCQHLKKTFIFSINVIVKSKFVLIIRSTNPLYGHNIWTWGRWYDSDLSRRIASKRHTDNLERTSPLYDFFHQWKNKSGHKPRRSSVCDTERNDRDLQSCHYEPKPTRRRRTIFLPCQ